jgi:hypothetical protein
MAISFGKPFGKNILSGAGVGFQFAGTLMILYQMFLNPYIPQQFKAYGEPISMLLSMILGFNLTAWLHKARLYKP